MNSRKVTRTTRVGTFDVCVPTHVALCIFIMQVLASQLHFLANRNACLTIKLNTTIIFSSMCLTVPPLPWPVNCTKIGRHVELPSGLTVHPLFCA